MPEKCPKCQWPIHELNLPTEKDLQVRELIRRGERMRLVQLLYKSLPIDLKTAKGIMIHQNFQPGVCVNCHTEGLTEERTNCTNCGAFNYNLDLQEDN